MTTAEFAARVTRAGAWTIAALSSGAWWLWGPAAAAGVAGGGAVALVNFRWLARDVERAVGLIAAGGGGIFRVGRIGLRQVVTLGAIGLLVAQGWVHPVAVGVGLAALPPVLLVQGLIQARTEG